MAHEILGDRFFQADRKPAWHGIMKDNIDVGREYTAAEAYDLIGRIEVRKVALVTAMVAQSTGQPVASPYFGLLRAPVPEDPRPAWLGSVSDDYELVTPDEVVALWDEHVRRPVQTAIVLRDGRCFVLSAKLPSFSVRGEDVDNVGMIVNWMDGANASTAAITSVTPVCMNTVQWGLSAASEKYRFRHDAEIRTRMGNWFSQVIGKLDDSLPALAEAMDVMTGYRLTQPQEEVEYVLKTAYPTPVKPSVDKLASPEYNELRLAKWEAEVSIVDERRVTAFELFKGSGTGMRTKARLGTAWGLYQAVSEVEDCRKGSVGAGLASSLLIGDRGTTNARAFGAAYAVATQSAALA